MFNLNIIGCGNVAKTIAFLWRQSNSIQIVDVINRSQISANNSVEFIGAGKPLDSIEALRPADIFVIACGDDDIEHCLDKLLEQNIIQKNNIVFHFSGAKSSSVLEKAKDQGALCASLHPVKSFANPANAVTTFKGTYCALEGNEVACDILEKLVNSIGGDCFKVESNKKQIYHSASVFASNYLVALQELSLRAFAESGVDRKLAMKILEPIVKETSNNVFEVGLAKALTGPIARGDHKLIENQIQAIEDWDADSAELYRLLGKLSVDLSDEKGSAEKTDLLAIKELFSR